MQTISTCTALIPAPYFNCHHKIRRCILPETTFTIGKSPKIIVIPFGFEKAISFTIELSILLIDLALIDSTTDKKSANQVEKNNATNNVISIEFIMIHYSNTPVSINVLYFNSAI